MPKPVFRALLGSLILLLLVSLSCSLVNQVQEGVGEVRETAIAIGTEVGQGGDLLGTLQAVGTQLSESDMVGTLQAAATAVDESGFAETAQAVLTEQGPALVETFQAAATQVEESGALETAQAFITQEGPEFVETVQAAGTLIPDLGGDAPADIPLLEGEKENLFTSSGLVTYSSPASFEATVAFYEAQMPTQGWTQDTSSSVKIDNNAVLTYTKDSRTATITITPSPYGPGVLVVIAIT